MLVHLEAQDLLRRYVLFEVTFDESLVTSPERGDLPRGWRNSPPPVTVQELGDRWLEAGRSAVLRVPSVIVPTEWNYLLDPMHADFGRIVIGPKRAVQFDPRLVKR